MLRNRKAKGALAARDVEAAWRRKLIDRLAGLELEPSPFDGEQLAAAGPAQRARSRLPANSLAGAASVLTLIKPSVVVREIRRDIRSVVETKMPRSSGAQTFALGLSSVVLTGLIWSASYVMLADQLPDIANPIGTAVMAVFEPATPTTVAAEHKLVAASETPVTVASLEAATDPMADLAPLAKDAEAFPTPGMPTTALATVAAKTTIDPHTTPATVPAQNAAATPASDLAPASAAIARDASAAVATNPATSANAASKAATGSARETVLALLQSNSDTIDNTIGHLGAADAPASSDPLTAKTAPADVTGAVATVKVVAQRHRTRARIVRALPGSGLNQGLMALGADKAVPLSQEILPWLRNQTSYSAAGVKVIGQRRIIRTRISRAAFGGNGPSIALRGSFAFEAAIPAPVSKNWLDSLVSKLGNTTNNESSRLLLLK